MTMEILGEGSYRSARCGRRLEEVVATSVFDDGDVWFGIHLRSDNWDIHRMSQNCKKILNWYGYIFRDGFVVGAGFWGFVGSSWQQMFIFCTVMPSYACCQRYCCKISSIWYIYIYMHTSKISSSWVTRNKTYCTCTARNYITLSTVLCHLASEYQREKFNFALLRHAQMIGFCLLLCCRFL